MLIAVWFDAIESLKYDGCQLVLLNLKRDEREFLKSDKNSQSPHQICFHHLPSD